MTLLMHLDASGGAIRQNALAVAAGWERNRLSHLLTRTEERGQLRRERLRVGVEVTRLDPGRRTVDSIRSAPNGAVTRHFSNRLTGEQLIALDGIVRALGP